MMQMKDSKKQIETKIKELQDRASRIKADLSSPLEADFSEQATQLENREVLEKLYAITVQEIATLEKELK